MSVVLGVLSATILIAGMILFRILMDRRALQTRIRSGNADRECEQAGCFRGCSGDDGIAPEKDFDAGPNK
jgi:hypothetical protein